MDISIFSDQEMQDLGAAFVQVLNQGDVMYLVGKLGVGKTTLARGLVHALGYQGKVTSPTFTIMNIYPTVPPVYHFDFYRLENDELDELGLEEYLERDGIAVLEWPHTDSRNLPREAIIAEINLLDDDYERERLVHISAQGSKYKEKVERLMQLVDPGHR